MWEAFEDYRLGASFFSRPETAVVAALAAGDPAAARRVADEAGWLQESAQGGWKRHRERQELEAKLAHLNLTVPW